MKLNKGKSILLFILTLILTVAVGFVSAVGVGKTNTGAAKNIILGLDLKGGVSITYKVTNKSFTKEELSDTKYKLELRVSEMSNESEVYTEGDDKITVDIPGEYDSEKVIEELGKPGNLMFVTVSDTDYSEQVDDTNYYTDESGNKYYVPASGTNAGTTYRVWVSGDEVADATAKATTDEQTGASENVVSLTMTDEGKTNFATATTENLNSTISILYDDEVISSPTVNSVISDGNAVIEGSFTMDEAENLASTIRIGSLSLNLEQISNSVISARLGNDAIETSLVAGLIGLLIVMLFMIIVYRIPGLAASIALAIYTIFELLILNGFDLTLTLPGIAGIILSIGMAVDANVIIYARIKEEIADGRAVDVAIKTGFKKATSAIVDGNVTTFIAAMVLMWKGSGTVQGFATTLAIGIVLSMFTAMVISRFLVYLLYNMGFKSEKFYGVQKARKTWDFVGKKTICFTLSIVVALAGFVTMFIYSHNDKGAFNYSIEFVGGTSTTVEFEKDYSIDEFNENIKPEIKKIIGSDDISGQKQSDSNTYKIKTSQMTEEEKAEVQEMLIEKFGAKLQDGESNFESSTISSSVSDQMKSDAIVAVILATICMLIYIWFRFKNLRFAGSAVTALIHDVVIVLGFYAISRTTVGTTFIACMLTIVGYSINATIVIFDRIRENLADKNKDQVDLKDVVNQSITQTLTRSIYTSFTTFIMVAVLYVMGVASVREFALPIMVGIVVGGYSSVFITGALWYIMSKKAYGAGLAAAAGKGAKNKDEKKDKSNYQSTTAKSKKKAKQQKNDDNEAENSSDAENTETAETVENTEETESEE